MASPTDKLPISKVEAFNYHKVKPNISQQFRDDFLSKGGDISVIKKYLNDFISNHKKDIISDVSESKGSYGHTDDVPIHFKTSLKSGSKYNETQIYRKKVNNIKECEDVFQILDKGNRGKIKSFLKLETVIGDNTETVTDYRYANSFIDLDVPCKTYYNDNTDNYNRIYKVVSSTQTNVIYDKYDKDKNGDGGEYFEMIASLLQNGDYTNYRMPFLTLTRLVSPNNQTRHRRSHLCHCSHFQKQMRSMRCGNYWTKAVLIAYLNTSCYTLVYYCICMTTKKKGNDFSEM